ncbi:MAG: VPLPA-CTERM-specific exosortase XrtD [Sulfitobacter sp.]|uniref:VPLPA-CTERM-specific exosortase XrtD n=1 Tax=Sulfitobacter sp. TaxID=1903071 RepID=UPI004059143C
MTIISDQSYHNKTSAGWLHWGLFWLAVNIVAAGVFFSAGFDVLLDAWSRPEYSHGPLIPILSGLMFLRELKQYPAQPGPKSDRWPGLFVVLVSVAIAVTGVLLSADSLVAYAMIIWIGGILLLSFGWQTGKHFWPPVLHLVFMLPLPGMVYYEVSTFLQLVSSELGVWFLRIAGVPVFLDGNIIDLGVLKLHVAEACSGLRYLFPILSFSYVFAFLYQGPKWHKALLLLAAAPIAVFMNSVRIALAGILMQRFGAEWLEGFTHFFEGWVIFMASVLILFLLAWILLKLNPRKMGLTEALDLDTQNILPQMSRVKLVQPSAALIIAAGLMVFAASAWPLVPERTHVAPERFSFALFPKEVGAWTQYGDERRLSPDIEKSLAADDYLGVQYSRSISAPTLDFFTAWYKDLSADGVQHTPEICLPGAGWEIAEVQKVDLSGKLGLETPFNVNRVIIQKEEDRMIVYYWFTHMGRTIPRNTAAKFSVLTRGLVAGRTDGAILRLISPIDKDEPDGEAKAEAEMNALLKELLGRLPSFIPGA